MDDAVWVLAASGAIFGAAVAISMARPALVVAAPRATLALLAGATLAAAAAILRIDPPGVRIALDPSSEPLLPLRDPGREVYREAVLDFGSDDIYVIAMETTDVFAEESLATLRRVSDRIRRLPGVRGAESLVDTVAFRWDPEEEWIEVGKLIDEIPASARELESLRVRVLEDPLYPKVIVSRDARTAAVNVTFQPMTDGEFVARDLDGRIRSVLEEESDGDRRFSVSGRPHIRSQAHHLMVRDLLRLIPLAVAVGALTLWLMTASVRGTLLPLGNCLTATLWAFGAMALAGRDLNIITLVLAPMLICVGGVYGVHVVARYELAATETSDARAAALSALRYTRLPILISGVTTCIGFAALLLTDVQATKEFACFSVFGVAAVTFLSLTGVPAALALLPLERGRPATLARRASLSAWAQARIDSALRALAALCIRYSGRVILGWTVLTALAISLVPRIVIDTDYLTVFDPESRVRTDFDRVNGLLAGVIPIYVVFLGEVEGTFREPEALRAIADLQTRLESVPGVSAALSAVDLVRVANRALHEGRPEEERIPDTRAEVAEAILTIPKERLRRFATSNHSSANVVVRTGRLGSAAMRDLEAAIRAELRRTAVPPGLRTDVTGSAILINRSADGIAGTQIGQVGLTAATIFLLVCAVFRSARVGVLSMVPNVVPVVLFFGILGTGVATLSIATSLIGSIALGIAIDDTAHLVSSYFHERGDGHGPEQAIFRSLRSVGRPIVMTSLMLMAGFLVVLGSGFVTLREFGYLTALTMGICLTGDLSLLPALLVRARP